MPFKSQETAIILQSIIDAQDNAFVVIDKDYTIVAANKAYRAAYGLREEDINHIKCHKASHHSEEPCFMNGEDCPHKAVFETGQPHHVLHIHFDANNNEEHVRIKGSPIHSPNGDLFLGEAVFPVAKSEDLECEEQRMLGTSPAFLACVEEMAGAAKSDSTILLNGESGVGKEPAAKFIHRKSTRRARPFVAIDCMSIAEGIFESELFGHERGAFTGCVGRRHGLIETADGGTLFLDEIGEVPLAIQGRLLRAIETGHFRRLGGRDDLHVNIRIICATNQNLRKMVEEGAFRADLYYRIAGICITIPPLRERRGDIVPIVNAMLSKMKSSTGKHCTVDDDAIKMLTDYDYPGNIRELRNILEKALSLSTNGIITPEQLDLDEFANIHINPLADHRARHRGPIRNLKEPTVARSINEVEATHIESLLHQYHGHRARVAEILKISERTLYRKLKQYNMQDVGKRRAEKRA